jgi:hypothetical protein
MQASGKPEEVRVRAQKPAPIPEPEVEDAEIEDAEEIEEAPRPVRSKSRQVISARRLGRASPPETDDEEEEEPAPRPRPRRFKRRKRPRPKSTTPRSYRWVGWVVVSVIYLLAAGGLTIHMIISGHTFELVVHAIEWAILMPVTLVIFFVSMFISSAIAGGIDFGDVKTAIPKALFLLAPVNFINVLLFGWAGFFLTLPVMVIGFIILFGLDLWEARFVVLINWILIRGALFLINLTAALIIRGPAMPQNDFKHDFDDQRLQAPGQKAPRDPQQWLRR